jgi:hypothetical protein
MSQNNLTFKIITLAACLICGMQKVDAASVTAELSASFEDAAGTPSFDGAQGGCVDPGFSDQAEDGVGTVFGIETRTSNYSGTLPYELALVMQGYSIGTWGAATEPWDGFFADTYEATVTQASVEDADETFYPLNIQIDSPNPGQYAVNFKDLPVDLTSENHELYVEGQPVVTGVDEGNPKLLGVSAALMQIGNTPTTLPVFTPAANCSYIQIRHNYTWELLPQATYEGFVRPGEEAAYGDYTSSKAGAYNYFYIYP